MACRYEKDRLVKGPKINQYVGTVTVPSTFQLHVFEYI